MPKQFYLLVNPTSGANKGSLNYHEVTQELDKQKIKYETIISKHPGYLVKAAKLLANEVKNDKNSVLLVIGGDGSLNQVLNGIKKSAYPDTPIAYFPSGTGDDFARALNLNYSVSELIHNLNTEPTVTKVDCGYFIDENTHKDGYFVNNLGIGFDAYVVAQTNNSSLKKRLGHFSYGVNVFKALFNQPTFKVTVKENDKIHYFDDAFLVTTTNHPYFGGGVPILRKAKPTNHLLDVVVVEKPSLIKFIYLFSKLLLSKKQLKDSHYHYFGAKELEVVTQDLEYGQLDGEELGSKNFDLLFQVQSFNLLT